MRLGVISDIHLNPSGSEPCSYHNEYGMVDAEARFRLALRWCAEEDIDAVAILGDLSHFGDDESLEAGVAVAAGSGLPVLVLPGNHDVLERAEALAEAVERVGGEGVRLAAPEGEEIGGIRVAGLSVRGVPPLGARSDGWPGIGGWGGEPVVLLTHYSVVSLIEKVARQGFKHPGDLEDLQEVAAPLLRREGPTVVLHGHVHVRDALSAGSVLQVSCAALIEPPFEVTLFEVEVEGGRTSVYRKSVMVVSSPDGVRLPVLSPPEEAWVFGMGAWQSAGSGQPRERS